MGEQNSNQIFLYVGHTLFDTLNLNVCGMISTLVAKVYVHMQRTNSLC